VIGIAATSCQAGSATTSVSAAGSSPGSAASGNPTESATPRPTLSISPILTFPMSSQTPASGAPTSTPLATTAAPAAPTAGAATPAATTPAATTPTTAPASTSTTSPSSRATPGSPPATAAPGGTDDGDPFTGARLYIDPNSGAARQEHALESSDPATARLLGRLATTPDAMWFGDNTPSDQVRAQVAARLAPMRAAGALPVLVVYEIPNRDCGSFSAGGRPSAADYRAWIRAFTAGVGSAPAAVILEPDALAGLDCLSPGDQQTRYELLKDAVTVMSSAGIDVYIDAGHAEWQPATEIARRLKLVGVDQARGFSLNVSGFGTTQQESAYGEQVSNLLGGHAFYVIDTSRNGRGPTADHQWCNPPGRAIGAAPTADTGTPHGDGLLWIKVPGESDGPCNGGPPSGQWWTSYAASLVQNAAA